MGDNFRYKGSAGTVGPFLTSGKPYLKTGTFTSGSAAEEVKITFPAITKSLLVMNNENNSGSVIMRVHFDTRVGNTYVVDSDGNGCNIPLYPGDSLALDIKCSDLYVSRDAFSGSAVTSTYSVMAECTGITDSYTLSGSGINLLP